MTQCLLKDFTFKVQIFFFLIQSQIVREDTKESRHFKIINIIRNIFIPYSVFLVWLWSHVMCVIPIHTKESWTKETQRHILLRTTRNVIFYSRWTNPPWRQQFYVWKFRYWEPILIGYQIKMTLLPPTLSSHLKVYDFFLYIPTSSLSSFT